MTTERPRPNDLFWAALLILCAWGGYGAVRALTETTGPSSATVAAGSAFEVEDRQVQVIALLRGGEPVGRLETACSGEYRYVVMTGQQLTGPAAEVEVDGQKVCLSPFRTAHIDGIDLTTQQIDAGPHEAGLLHIRINHRQDRSQTMVALSQTLALMLGVGMLGSRFAR